MGELPLTIEAAAVALRARELSSTELTTGFLERIERLPPALGAFLVVTADGVLTAAHKADADFAAGVDRGPLQGIPLGIKDILATNDAATTANSNVLDPAGGDGWDAPVCARLRSAGAALLGSSSNTLPLSMQIIGKPFAEATVLKAGDAYQRLTDWHLRVPPIAVAIPA